MSDLHAPLDTAFAPVVWLLPDTGTNGQVSSWGAKLAGTAPPRTSV
ncbi:hypothetical protein [Jonesia quinghaiensis]|nr:hypothetical protein [Jonesia quinghaiensis]